MLTVNSTALLSMRHLHLLCPECLFRFLRTLLKSDILTPLFEKFHTHSMIPRIDISRLSERQLRSYFTAFNATPAQILRNSVWFMSDAFIAVVHTFPEYEEALIHHAATIAALTFLIHAHVGLIINIA